MTTSRKSRQRPLPAATQKTRITIRLDDDVLDWFRRHVRAGGGSYQTAINLALRDFIAREPLEATLRRVVREELARVAARPSSYGYESEPLPRALVAENREPYGAGKTRRRRKH